MMSEPLRGNDVRKKNEQLVLRIIHKSSGISQSEVVQLTGLKPPTVFRIFTKLEEQGLIHTVEKEIEATDKKGRRPVFYQIKADARFTIGIDFWVRSASIVIVNFSGEAVYEQVKSLHDFIDAQQLVEVLKDLIESSLQQSGIDRAKLIGIGIGAPGRVDIEEGMVLHYGRIKGMQNFSIKSPIEKAFGLPVYVHNNAAVVALSEYRYGVAKGRQALLTVLVRSGVGGSYINDGEIFVTKNRTTLEVGHMTVDINGRKCECGHRGCLESYVSEEAMHRDFEDAGLDLSMQDIDEAIQSGNKEVLSIIDKKINILAEGIYSLYQLFNPDSFLLVTRSKIVSKYIGEEIEKRLNCSDTNAGKGKCSILHCAYDPILAGIGAADLVMDKFFTRF